FREDVRLKRKLNSLMHASQVQWPCEWLKYTDEQTGTRVTRLTSAPCTNHPLYYLTNSFTFDGRWLIFASDRAGKMDLYRVSLDDGEITRLTDLAGMQPFSGNVVDDDVYFCTDGQVHRLSMHDATDRVIVDRPGCGFGEISMSCDRRWLASL